MRDYIFYRESDGVICQATRISRTHWIAAFAENNWHSMSGNPYASGWVKIGVV